MRVKKLLTNFHHVILQVQSGETKELFPLGSRQQEPLITRLEDDRLLLGRDEMSIAIDQEGAPTLKFPINWNDIPIEIGAVCYNIYRTEYS